MELSSVEELVPAPGTTWRAGDAYLSGGSGLFSQRRPQLRRLLDLTAYRWPSLVDDDGGLEIAATCTLAELAVFLRDGWPATALFAAACGTMQGPRTLWNSATVGGNVYLALPSAPVVALAAALDGVCTSWLPDGTVMRRAVVDVVVAPGRTSLLPGELLRSVRLPASALRSRVAHRAFSPSPGGVCAAHVIGRVSSAEVLLAVTAATQRPVRLRYPRLPTAGTARADLDHAVRRWHEDGHGSAEWRRAISLQLLGEVLEELA